MIFYLGTHVLSHAQHIDYSFISVNRLPKYCSKVFKPNHWIMDSGAFTEISTYGHYRSPVYEYANRINHWKTYGNLELAVTQDYMCEDKILKITGMTIRQHQGLTIQRYDELIKLTDAFIMPVLQGYKPHEYVECLKMYEDRIKIGMRVGVGSVCKRNKEVNSIIEVLEAIKEQRPDLKLHGFGLKTTALINAYIDSLLYSADSMAWSYAARRNKKDRNGLTEALDFKTNIDFSKGKKPNQMKLYFKKVD
ncbi:MAG: hypothetical protein WC389_18720 [Lutibacter sp.]|jgi:hypothetical protein